MLRDGDDWDEDEDEEDSGTGLINPFPHGAFIYTGIHTGKVRVSAAAVTGEPGPSTTDAWDEVVDISVHAREGDLRVRSF